MEFPFPHRLFQYTEAADPHEIQRYVEDHPTTTNLLTRPIWCHACNAPSFEEHVPTLAEFTLALSILRDPEGRMPQRLEAEPFDAELVRLGNYEGIDYVQYLGSRLINRTPSRRCLACGSPSFSRIESGRRATRLRHDGCGGELAQWGQISGGSYIRETWHTRYFNWDGTFRWAILFTHEAGVFGWQRELRSNQN